VLLRVQADADRVVDVLLEIRFLAVGNNGGEMKRCHYGQTQEETHVIPSRFLRRARATFAEIEQIPAVIPVASILCSTSALRENQK
jgi:hypothetical protein